MLPPSARRAVALAAVIAALALQACGSTVPQSLRDQAERRAGAADGLDVQDSTGSIDGTGETASSVAAGSSGATGNSDGANPSKTNGGTPTTRQGSTALGPGISDTTINLGLGYSVNSAAGNAAIGGAGISQGDQKTEYQIVVDDINAHGGVLGRKLVPVWAEFDVTSPETTDQTYQGACDTWTQDNKTFAVFAGGNETMLQCANNRGVVTLEDNLTEADAATFQRYPYYVELTSINLDRAAKQQVTALNAQHYFTGWDATLQHTTTGKAKVGILTYDLPGFAHATDKVLVPALTALGYAPAAQDIIKVSAPQRTSDTGAVAAAVSSAVLKFRNDGVEHVVIYEANAVLSLLFLNNAQAQRYFPRYGINSQNGFEVLIDTGDVPKTQVVGSMGIGWSPMLDMPPAQNPDNGPYSNDARRACIKLMSSHGIQFADTNAEAVGIGVCNSLWFFRDVAKRVTSPLNRASFMASVNSLGPSFQATESFATNFSPTQHDGIAAIRWYAYDANCTCMQYKSGNVPV